MAATFSLLSAFNGNNSGRYTCCRYCLPTQTVVHESGCVFKVQDPNENSSVFQKPVFLVLCIISKSLYVFSQIEEDGYTSPTFSKMERGRKENRSSDKRQRGSNSTDRRHRGRKITKQDTGNSSDREVCYQIIRYDSVSSFCYVICLPCAFWFQTNFVFVPNPLYYQWEKNQQPLILLLL